MSPSPRPRRLFVLLADLVGSRSLPNRRAVGANVERALQELGSGMKDVWAAPPVTTRGIDEISAAMRSPERAFDAAVTLNSWVWPARFRFALAAGEVDIGAFQRDAANMDGAAFHLATAALARAEQSGMMLAIDIDVISSATCALIEAAAAAHGELMNGWTERQAAVVRVYRSTRSQGASGRKLKMTQQGIQQHLARAHESALTRIESAIRQSLTMSPS